jgi:D-alanyl-D-alanine carboxypeptidase
MNHHCKITLVLLLTVSFGCVVYGQTPASKFDLPKNLPRILSTLQTHLDQSRGASKFPGAQVGFTWIDSEASGASRYYSGSVASGLSDIEHKTPLKTSDRLLAGSVGKTFVATVALMLVEQGKLNLDEKISTALGNESWFSRLPNGQSITLRMLLNHSSGIPNHVDLPAFESALYKSASHDIDYSELIGYVLNKKPLFPAGQGYSYSDTNYILAGMIIEKVSGKTLYELVDELILKPRKLERTIPSNALVLPEVSNGYLSNKPVIVNGRFTINPQWEWAGGGFASTAEELSRWAAMLYDGEILKRKSLDEMFSSTTTGDGANYGLGVMITNTNWGKAYGHDGEFPGYLSEMRYYPKFHLAIAVMVNADENPEVSRFVASAADDFAGDIINALVGREISLEQQDNLKQLATSWLNLIDTERYAESWKQLGSKLKAKYNESTWKTALHPLLSQTGKIKRRTFRSVNYSDSQGESVVVEFESSFTNLPSGRETVTMVQEEGQWKIVGYGIH